MKTIGISTWKLSPTWNNDMKTIPFISHRDVTNMKTPPSKRQPGFLLRHSWADGLVHPKITRTTAVGALSCLSFEEQLTVIAGYYWILLEFNVFNFNLDLFLQSSDLFLREAWCPASIAAIPTTMQPSSWPAPSCPSLRQPVVKSIWRAETNKALRPKPQLWEPKVFFFPKTCSSSEKLKKKQPDYTRLDIRFQDFS